MEDHQLLICPQNLRHFWGCIILVEKLENYLWVLNSNLQKVQVPKIKDLRAHLIFGAYSLVHLEKKNITCYDSICWYTTSYQNTNICYDNTNTSHDDIRYVNPRYVNICYDII
ncbi:hypothetical protein PVNG_04906 [Plasmodium vivax North Korean]|uniref:Uncharacterized protein n=1 Tax=Plasmodium vivax North Korean TaxID=1035514 RepID=A0A0J9WF25_PLAVI|nr:hypothetical protein PVNG_04906 [Plasmodium vivax North Korean]